HTLERLRQRAKNASQRRIRCQSSEKRLRRDQLSCVAMYLVQGEEEDAIALKELAAIETADVTDYVRSRQKLVHQRVSRIIGGFRRRRVDNGDDLIDPLRKSTIEHEFLLPPRQRTRQQIVAVGGDGEMPRDIADGDDCHEQEAKDHRPRIATRQPDQPCNCGYRRKITIYFHGLL